VIGYRAQQVRPVAVHEANPAYLELSRLHGELYPRLLETFSPASAYASSSPRTFAIGAKQRGRQGVTANAKTSLIIHGRGLGDDYPLLVTNLDGQPSARTERMLDYVFPANGVYILKPTIATADDRFHFIWGDTVHVGPAGARRMGGAPHGLVISQPQAVNWPQTLRSTADRYRSPHVAASDMGLVRIVRHRHKEHPRVRDATDECQTIASTSR